MRYWWVNQNQTYKHEIRGGLMWSPKFKKGGRINPFYETMKRVEAGDIVFSFCDTRIKAIGIATGRAETSPKPEFGAAGANWDEEGWYIPVDYCTLGNQIRPKDHIEILRPFLPARYSPLQHSGNGNQTIYLTEIPDGLAAALIALIGDSYYQALAEASVPAATGIVETQSEQIEHSVAGGTFRDQIVRARRGQGIFRSNVRQKEYACRVTHVDDEKHLRASHIKPWRDSNDRERLDGSNGLLLAPHVDHLFDGGYISFSSGQGLLVVPEVRHEILDAWGIDEGATIGEFSREQNAYLDYHRSNIFRGR